MKEYIHYEANAWSKKGMKRAYRRTRHIGQQHEPDKSRFYMRKAMKIYNQYVRPRSFFLRHFNWIMAPLIRRIVARSIRSYGNQWTAYR
jgi:hypothetical protein